MRAGVRPGTDRAQHGVSLDLAGGIYRGPEDGGGVEPELPLFEEIDRTYAGPITAGETHYAYLNRSARPEVCRIRQFLDNCLARYPAAHHAEMEARLRSEDRVHKAALFKLVVHELLVRSRNVIVAIEPPLKHTPRSPDFLVEATTGERFYLECAVATGQTDAQAAAERRLQQALDAAESVPSPHHVLALAVDGRPSVSITTSRLKDELDEWVATLPLTDEAKEAAPYIFEEHGLALSFTVWRYQEAPRDEDERSVGITSYGVHSSEIGAGLRGALLRKAKRYGDLELPYVVAVNTLQFRSLERELFDVLLGTPRMVFRRYEDGRIETFDERAPDGIWTNGSRPRKRGMSAVWSFDGLTAWNPAARSVELVRNPWAYHPLPPINLFAEEWNPINDEFKKSGETETRSVLGLSDHWPEEP